MMRMGLALCLVFEIDFVINDVNKLYFNMFVELLFLKLILKNTSKLQNLLPLFVFSFFLRLEFLAIFPLKM